MSRCVCECISLCIRKVTCCRSPIEKRGGWLTALPRKLKRILRSRRTPVKKGELCTKRSDLKMGRSTSFPARRKRSKHGGWL